MRFTPSLRFLRAVAIYSIALMGGRNSGAASEKVVHSFLGGQQGYRPTWGVMFVNGNMYGTTYAGGKYDLGVAYELQRTRDGWKEIQLHHFGRRGEHPDGEHPNGPLVADTAGNFYGTTTAGGARGYGTVFELSLESNGGWRESVLYNFCATTCEDGAYPEAGLIVDGMGNLYGTTSRGGSNSDGNVFKLSRSSTVWTLTTIYSFSIANGYWPASPLLQDANGNLYGTTNYGGNTSECSPNGCRTVFELSPSGTGWNFATLYAFTAGNDASYPTGALVMDSAGNLYGAAGGGPYQMGTIYKLAPSEGSWAESVLYDFTPYTGGGGEDPVGVILDPETNLYGTTLEGTNGYAVAFKLTSSGRRWKELVLHKFRGHGDGVGPSSGLTWDRNGNLLGTTSRGGSVNHGTIYEITP